jgi:hypothetical protein
MPKELIGYREGEGDDPCAHCLLEMRRELQDLMDKYDHLGVATYAPMIIQTVYACVLWNAPSEEHADAALEAGVDGGENEHREMLRREALQAVTQ